MDNALAIQREITPAIWEMLSAITESTSRAQMEKVIIAQKMLFCYENNLPLNLAFNGGLYSVNNRVEVEGVVIRAQLRRHPEYDYEIKEQSNTGCTIAITRNGELLGDVTFDENDAKLAGLLSKGADSVWHKYPADMYLNRATSRAYKRFAPDIFFNSVYVRGEIQGTDFDIIEGVEVEPVPTFAELIKTYGQDTVMAGMQIEGNDDLFILREWLEEDKQ